MQDPGSEAERADAAGAGDLVGLGVAPAADAAPDYDARSVEANVARARARAAEERAREAARAAEIAAARGAEAARDAERDSDDDEVANDASDASDDDTESETARTGSAGDASGRVGFAVGVAGALGVGVLPSVAPGVAISAAFLGPSWRLGLRVGYAPSQHAALSNPPARAWAGAGGKVALASAAVEGGFRWLFAAVEVPLVAGVEAGVFDSIGENVRDRQRRSAAWLATYVGSGIGLQMTRALAAGLRVEGLVPLFRPEFALDDAGTPLVFHRPSSFGGRVALMLEARWQ